MQLNLICIKRPVKIWDIHSEIGLLGTRKVIANHIWYLSDELLSLALFSQIVSSKEKIIQGMNNPKCKKAIKFIYGCCKPWRFFNKKKCWVLFFYSNNNISDFFLQILPDKWKDNIDHHYKRQLNQLLILFERKKKKRQC